MADSNNELDLTRYDGHTPEPWRAVRPEVTPDGRWAVQQGVGTPRKWIAAVAPQPSDPVFPLSRETTEAAANARLIADAPKLLDECRRLRAERDAALAGLRFCAAVFSADERSWRQISKSIVDMWIQIARDVGVSPAAPPNTDRPEGGE